ncbi:FecCD family ABC transporter permease [Puniceicoccus vermicola]|uniref:Iron ABC transporter permease n=1 Tax=Puniceicoccus vermicola TaxID=388746 RepID=A0A7X1AYG5_9BACT|nr:iron ABC transporter permease [Puniceicoccus vermicola]MBC2602318.1 iron ABC transporter permease [Puniceicoccus vermicola]
MIVRWGCFLLLVSLFLAAIAFGSVTIPLHDVFLFLTGRLGPDTAEGYILQNIRLPRALTASVAGAGLAFAGLQMQTVFRNPLADPYILGVNSGASLGVAIVMLVAAPVGPGLLGTLAGGGAFSTVIAASIGSGAVLALILALTSRIGVMTLLIIGLMLAYLINAIVSILIYFAMPERLQAFISWSFGQFGTVSWNQFWVFLTAAGLAVIFGSLQFKSMDVLLLGEEQATALGENTRRTRIRILSSAAIIAGAVTAFCGPIGFLGVAVPHLARGLLRTQSHRKLIPVTLTLGASLALLSDLIARLPGTSTTLPVNAITALIGAPVIIWVLLKSRTTRSLS